MNRDYESYDETMARLTPAQLTALHEESVNLRTYVLEYYKATGFPARTRYVQFKIRSRYRPLRRPPISSGKSYRQAEEPKFVSQLKLISQTKTLGRVYMRLKWNTLKMVHSPNTCASRR